MSDFTQFDYLLNAMTEAGRQDKPSDHGYGDKRRALFAYVRDLEAGRASALPLTDLVARITPENRHGLALEEAASSSRTTGESGMNLEQMEAVARAADDQTQELSVSGLRSPWHDAPTLIEKLECDDRDAAHIATFGPPTVLRLIAIALAAKGWRQPSGRSGFSCWQ